MDPSWQQFQVPWQLHYPYTTIPMHYPFPPTSTSLPLLNQSRDLGMTYAPLLGMHYPPYSAQLRPPLSMYNPLPPKFDQLPAALHQPATNAMVSGVNHLQALPGSYVGSKSAFVAGIAKPSVQTAPGKIKTAKISPRDARERPYPAKAPKRSSWTFVQESGAEAMLEKDDAASQGTIDGPDLEGGEEEEEMQEESESYSPDDNRSQPQTHTHRGKYDGRPINDDKWMRKFRYLKTYFLVNGHSDVPARFKDANNLYVWVKNQRQLYQTGKLSEFRIGKLNTVNFMWRSNYSLVRESQTVAD